MALDDIKRQLDNDEYSSFEDVKQDMEQCFKNAKRYNMKESQIWKDAKHLHVSTLIVRVQGPDVVHISFRH